MGRDGARSERDVEDRIADELAGPVVGDVAAAVGLHELRADRLGVRQHVLGLGSHAERVDVRVLQEEQVFAPTAFAEGALQNVGVPVPDPPEPADVELSAGRAQSSAAQSRVSIRWLRSCRNADA